MSGLGQAGRLVALAAFVSGASAADITSDGSCVAGGNGETSGCEAPGRTQREQVLLQFSQGLLGGGRNATSQGTAADATLPPPPDGKSASEAQADTVGDLGIAAASGASGGWKGFGPGTRCGASDSERVRMGVASKEQLVYSLSACKDLCKQVRGRRCRGVEYSASTGSCRLFQDEVRHAHPSTDPSSDTECVSLAAGAEVYVMLPLDTISSDGRLKDPHGLGAMFDSMMSTGVDGFMVDIWWGITELQPREYDFTGYRKLFEMARVRGWKVQAVASFHRCGGNVGDSCNIPLPPFVASAGGIWYTDAEGVENKEYISLFADGFKLGGRTPLDMYEDWMRAFANEFSDDLGGLITELMVGMGPCGELRFPAYPLDRWSFCGVGQFQAFDVHARAKLDAAARAAGHPVEWSAPPSTRIAGSYTSLPGDTDFFTAGYKTEYGRFFLDWYSGALKAHGQRVLAAANAALNGKTRVTGKVAGIHWWYDSEHHAAEATAGYYNTNGRNIYDEIAGVFAAANASLDFTCMEMSNDEQPERCLSNPEALVGQAIQAARTHGIEMGGENALLRYDSSAMKKMISYRPHVSSLTFLRLNPGLVQPRNIARFAGLVMGLHGDDAGAAAMARLAEV